MLAIRRQRNAAVNWGKCTMNASQRDNAEVRALENDNPVVSAPPSAVGVGGVEQQAGPQVEDYDIESLTPLQSHYLDALRDLIAVKNEYQTGDDREAWMMDAINRSIYSALRDCMEANIGPVAKALLQQEDRVN